MPRDDSDRLQHMLTAARKASALTAGKSREDLEGDETLALAVIHLLEILGEAAKGVSTETVALNPDLPWKEMAATRDRLVHGYFSVDLDIVWQIIVEDVPAVIRALEEMMEPGGG